MMAVKNVPLPFILVPSFTFSSGQFGSLSYSLYIDGALSRRGGMLHKSIILSAFS